MIVWGSGDGVLSERALAGPLVDIAMPSSHREKPSEQHPRV
jgi:hypothetical protein